MATERIPAAAVLATECALQVVDGLKEMFRRSEKTLAGLSIEHQSRPPRDPKTNSGAVTDNVGWPLTNWRMTFPGMLRMLMGKIESLESQMFAMTDAENRAVLRLMLADHESTRFGKLNAVPWRIHHAHRLAEEVCLALRHLDVPGLRAEDLAQLNPKGSGLAAAAQLAIAAMERTITTPDDIERERRIAVGVTRYIVETLVSLEAIETLRDQILRDGTVLVANEDDRQYVRRRFRDLANEFRSVASTPTPNGGRQLKALTRRAGVLLKQAATAGAVVMPDGWTWKSGMVDGGDGYLAAFAEESDWTLFVAALDEENRLPNEKTAMPHNLMEMVPRVMPAGSVVTFATTRGDDWPIRARNYGAVCDWLADGFAVKEPAAEPERDEEKTAETPANVQKTAQRIKKRSRRGRLPEPDTAAFVNWAHRSWNETIGPKKNCEAYAVFMDVPEERRTNFVEKMRAAYYEHIHNKK